MTNVIFRRKGLGKSTCEGIKVFMKNPVDIVVNGRDRVKQGTRNLIRWGCTAGYPGLLLSGQVINTAVDISKVSNKGYFRNVLNTHGVCPPTHINPSIFNPERYSQGVVVRPNRHAQGKEIHLCYSEDEIVHTMSKYRFDAYWSQYIPKVKEYRVFLANRGVLCVIEKIPEDPTQLAWNHAQGSEIPNIRWSNWPIGAVKVAERACRLASLDFCAADVIEGEDGQFYVLELNSAPTLSPYRQEKFAKVFDYMLDNPNNYPERFPVDSSLESWEQCIHPAVMKKPETIPNRGYVLS